MFSILKPPIFPSEEQTHTARALHAILLSFMAALPLMLMIAILLPGNFVRWLATTGGLYGLCVFVFIFNQRGRTTFACITLIFGLWMVVTASALTGGGVRAAATAAYLIIMFITGLLLGGKAGIFTTLLCILTTLGLASAEATGHLPPSSIQHTPWSFWLAQTLLALIMVSLQNLASMTIKDALQQGKTELEERRRAEQAVRESEQLYRAMVDASPDGITVTDLQGRAVFVSDKTASVFGEPSANDILGKNILDWVTPDDRPRAAENIKNVIQGLGASSNEYRMLKKGGSEFISEVNSALLRGPNMEIKGMVSFARDITERKRAEEELEQSLRRLRALSERLQQIREEERTRISREMHDDLGQALTALKIDLTWLENKILPQQGTIAQRLVAMKDLVDSVIQSVQNISAELRVGVLDDLGLAAAVEWQTQEFQVRTGIQCDMSAMEEIPGIDKSAATACFRIYQETLTNIARHAQATKVSIRLSRQNGNIMLKVHDNGKGISHEEISGQRSIGIIGMKERAFALGGRLDIHGEPGSGTSVTVRIPIFPITQKHGL